MSRYIDADALHDALNAKQKWVVRCGDKHNEGYTYDQVHFAIDEAPSIDIVRCGECKHWHEKDGLTYCDRIDYGYGYKADDFCSYGSRSEKPNKLSADTQTYITEDRDTRILDAWQVKQMQTERSSE